MTTFPQLLAIRHAPTLTQGLCSGDAEVACCQSDSEAAEAMLGQIPAGHLHQVWTSPLSRCLGPAQIVAEKLRLPLRIDERLREISFGTWQGRSWTDIETNDGDRYREWLSNWEEVAPVGGETIGHLAHRVHTWWVQLDPGQHLLIAHAGVMRGLRVLARGRTWKEAMEAPVPHLKGEWFAGG